MDRPGRRHLRDVRSLASTSTDNIVTYDAPPDIFDEGPTASISGTPQVGQTLTAVEGSPSPAADSFDYQWFADDVEIGGDVTGSVVGEEKFLLLTEAEEGALITVRVTAVREGFANAADTSEPVGPVAPASSDGAGDDDDGDDEDDEDDEDEDGGLPDTGAPGDRIALIGLALILGGLAALNTAHRQRS